MSTNFEFNAPQCINFLDMEDPKADRFFDLQQEEKSTKKVISSKSGVTPYFKKLNSENRDPCLLTRGGLSSCKKTFPTLKKVLHEIVNQQIQSDVKAEPLILDSEKELVKNFEKLQLSKRKTNIQKNLLKTSEIFNELPNRSTRKSHQIITRMDAMNMKLQAKSVVRQALSYEDIPSYCSATQNTKIEPFSFDARMKAILQKKEDFIKKVIEEDKKKFNSFKAHPMPSFKNKFDQINKKHSQKTIPQPFNLTQVKRTVSNDNMPEIRVTPFKAKPADVVHQKPFIPKLERRKVIPPSDFHLNTEKRAAERLKFDEKVKQKEEEHALILKLQKEEEEKREIAKMLEDRKKAEFKARPMPCYKVFEIHGSDVEKITFPQSPYLRTKLRVAKKQSKSNEIC